MPADVWVCTEKIVSKKDCFLFSTTCSNLVYSESDKLFLNNRLIDLAISKYSEDKAFIFEKPNVNDLQKKLQYIVDNENIVKEYKESATDFICNKYNWDDIVDDTLKLYKNNGD